MKKLSKPMGVMNVAVLAGIGVAVVGLLASELFGSTGIAKVAIFAFVALWLVAVVSWVVNLVSPRESN